MTWHNAFIVGAVVLFALDAAGVPSGRFKLSSAGLACLALALFA